MADAFADAPLVVGGLAVLPEAENLFAFELELANEVTLAVESVSVYAGSDVAVRYEVAPDGDRNWVTVVPSDAPDGLYLTWSYVTGQASATLASAPLAVTPVTGSVRGPDDVAIGAEFQIDLTGPDNQGDYITIVPAGAPEGTYLSWTYTRRGSPLTLTAPDAPGAYEVRYVLGRGDRTLMSVPITVR